MQNSAWVFQIRWLFWVLGVGILFVLLSKSRAQYRGSAQAFCEKYFGRILFGICSSFFLLGFAEKLSQLYSMSLNSQDFWLNVDILEQMKRGGFFLTRFAPQSQGVVQHGAVHPSFSLIFLLPLIWLLGALPVALAYNPLSLAAAGAALGGSLRKKIGALSALLFTGSFLVSTQVGKILLYDMHPEAAYPVLVFLWLAASGLDAAPGKKINWALLILSCVLCVGIKEDSFLVLGPWILWSILFGQRLQRRTGWVSALVLGAGWIFQLLLVKNWTLGIWGPSSWNGSPVITDVGVRDFNGMHWSGISDIWKIVQSLIESHGGSSGFLKGIGSFYCSRAWLSLLVLAPWVVLDRRFWWTVLPLGIAYSLLEGPRHLWLYYSAPFLATFWYSAASGSLAPDFSKKYFGKSPVLSALQRKITALGPRGLGVWSLLAALLLGNTSIQLIWPSKQVLDLREEALKILPCLENEKLKKGLVAGHLLGFMAGTGAWEKIRTDRIPLGHVPLSNLDFALFSPHIDRYEMLRKDAERFFLTLRQNKEWIALGTDCKPSLEANVDSAALVLFVRRDLN